MLDAIEAMGLSKRFGSLVAVADVSLSIQRGTVLALLGPSGCGKTTLLRLLAGFEQPDTGTLRLGDQVVVDRTTFVPPERRRVGMVFQHYALFPHLDVAANVAYGLPRSASRGARVAEVLALTGLEGFEHRMPHELSGGQQQRVALARALAPQPTVLLLDEPFSNLDAALRQRVRQDLQAILRAVGTTTVFVTHDQAEALSLADLVGVMQNGHVLQLAAPEIVYRRPVSRTVAALVGEVNWLACQGAGSTASTVIGQVPLALPLHGPAQLLIRPEALEITPDPTGLGRILQVEFLGHEQIITVSLPDATTLRIRLSAFSRWLPGQSVQLHVQQPLVAFH